MKYIFIDINGEKKRVGNGQKKKKKKNFKFPAAIQLDREISINQNSR